MIAETKIRKKLLPDFVIIGGMKCGTTSLASQLGAHPDISMCEPKEPDFFSDAAVFERGFDWYADVLASGGAGRRFCGEASTSYAKYPEYKNVAEQIARHCPKTKFIYMVRNPIDRAVSHYKHRWFGRFIPKDMTFADYLSHDHTVIDFGQYYRQLQEYLKFYSPQQILVVVSEDFFADPHYVKTQVCNFIGADASKLPRQETKLNASESKIRKSQWITELRQSGIIPPGIRNMVPPSLKKALRNLGGNAEPPEINLEPLRGRLTAAFIKDAAQLSEYMGRDLVGLWKLDTKVVATAL